MKENQSFSFKKKAVIFLSNSEDLFSVHYQRKTAIW